MAPATRCTISLPNALRTALAFASLLLPALTAEAQQASPLGPPVPHRFLVGYREGTLPGSAQARLEAAAPGVRILHVHPATGMAVVLTDPAVDDALALAQLRAQPGVEFAVHDRILSGHGLRVRTQTPALIGVAAPAAPPAPYDTYYSTPQSWAVLAAGGYGAHIPGGPVHGPWDTTQAAGVRIAILDSGVDSTHPDIAPHLIFNLSEIDRSPITGMPSPCDDGSPQDQQGHGTWTASLAAGAIGPGTGQVIGVAPAASILNIKVLERMPNTAAAAAGISDLATQCKSGEPVGLLSWILQGIEDATVQHADIISLSLGALVDLTTGEGAGLKAAFDRATYAAVQAGAVVVASAGNDGLDLADPRYLELPAQARGVLAVVASTNAACAENLAAFATCLPGPSTLPYYSNFGAPLNAIAAPGGSLPPGPDTGVSGWVLAACSNGLPNTADGLPTDAAHSFGCFSLGHTQYVQAMGTSASAPLVAGAAALLRAAHPAWTPAQIVAALHTASVATTSLFAAPLLDPATLTQQLNAP